VGLLKSALVGLVGFVYMLEKNQHVEMVPGEEEVSVRLLA
jgi:hypothetical protein